MSLETHFTKILLEPQILDTFCFRFTWLGSAFNENSTYLDADCDEVTKGADVPCVRPLVVTGEYFHWFDSVPIDRKHDLQTIVDCRTQRICGMIWAKGLNILVGWHPKMFVWSTHIITIKQVSGKRKKYFLPKTWNFVAAMENFLSSRYSGKYYVHVHQGHSRKRRSSKIRLLLRVSGWQRDRSLCL